MIHAVATLMTATALATSSPELATKPAPPAKPKFKFHSIEQKLIESTNATRARHGLPKLRVDFGLMRSARRHAAWMTRSRSLQHTSASVAENIAMGQRSARSAMASWMSSAGHRANILNSRYTRLGVAAYKTPNGTIYWCQQFLW